MQIFFFVTHLKAFFSNAKGKYARCSSCNEILEAVNVCFDNIYVRYGNKVYHLVVGIFVCTHCVPFISDLLSTTFNDNTQ